MFDNNFHKWEPIFKIISPFDSSENSVRDFVKKRFPPDLQYAAILPSEMRKSKNVTTERNN